MTPKRRPIALGPRLLTGWHQVAKLPAIHASRSVSRDGKLGNPG